MSHLYDLMAIYFIEHSCTDGTPKRSPNYIICGMQLTANYGAEDTG